MKVGQRILSVSADGFEELRQLGLLRYNAGRDIEIYDYYLSEVDITGSRMQAQTNCAMRYNLSEKAIQVIVYGFENKLPRYLFRGFLFRRCIVGNFYEKGKNKKCKWWHRKKDSQQVPLPIAKYKSCYCYDCNYKQQIF